MKKLKMVLVHRARALSQSIQDDDVSIIPREILFGNPDQGMPSLSPDGSKITYCAPVKDVLNIYVGPIKDPKAAKPVTNNTHRGIAIYYWAYTGEHILYLQDTNGDANWQIHSLNLSSGETKNLTPFRGASSWIEAMSPKFPEEIIISINNRNPEFSDLFKLDIRTGNMTCLQENNEFQKFYSDDDYRIRLATKRAPGGGKDIFERTDQGDWKLLCKIGNEDEKTTGILGFDKTGETVYMWDSRNRNTAALYALDLKTGEKALLAEDPKADLSDLSWENTLIHPTEKNVQAVVINYERKKHWQVIDPTVEGDLEYLDTVEDGDFAVSSRTLQDNAWLVSYARDDGPGGIYYYDRTKKEAKFLFTGFKELEGKPLAKMHPVIIKSRDGLDLVSYYTLPLKSHSQQERIKPDRPGHAGEEYPCDLHSLPG
ncbi:MAG: TolB family protein [Methanothrix sp.]